MTSCHLAGPVRVESELSSSDYAAQLRGRYFRLATVDNSVPHVRHLPKLFAISERHWTLKLAGVLSNEQLRVGELSRKSPSDGAPTRARIAPS